MLSRHFLRAKALQTVYAGISNQTTSVDEIVKTFDYNVLRLNDLGVVQLSTLGQLAFTAERIIEAERQKFNPQEAEIKLLQPLAENRFITGLESSFELRQQINRLNIDWSNHFDIFRKVLNSFKTSKQYCQHIELPSPSFADERDIAIVAFKHLMNETSLRDIIYDRDLLWEDDFDQIAQYNYMMLKEIDEDSANEALPCPLVYDKRKEKEVTAYLFARDLAVETFKHIDDVEPLIRKHLQNWDFERVAFMDILLINMAVAEFTSCPSIPERVTVDEYIELSKEFSTEKSKLFINGILDKILIELRVAGRINKDERGLYDPELDENEENN